MVLISKPQQSNNKNDSTSKDRATKKTRSIYNRIASVYDITRSIPDLLLLGKWRKRLAEEAEGRVLEVGIGTGRNLSLYTEKVDEVHGIDLSPGMLEKARNRAKNLEVSDSKNIKVNLSEMDVQNLEFSGEHFDTIISTFVFCSVPDPIKGLKEVRRVVKPSGKVLMLEHVLSGIPILSSTMKLLNPVAGAVSGSEISRKTLKNLEKADLKIVKNENVLLDVIKFVEAKR